MVQTNVRYREFIKAVKKKVNALGVPLAELKNMSRSSDILNFSRDYIEKNCDNLERSNYCKDIDVFLREFELKWVKKSTIFPDTLYTLSELKKLGYPMGIVTNTSRVAAVEILTSNEIHDYFDVLVTRTDVKKLKPDPEGISLALNTLNVKKFLFIGDLEFDYEAAKSMGGLTVIRKSKHPKLNSDADYTINKLSEILAILKEINPL